MTLQDLIAEIEKDAAANLEVRAVWLLARLKEIEASEVNGG